LLPTFALPGAIGAQLAYPDRRVFGIAGDGGFAMLMGDFVTAVRYELPIIMIVLNNSKLAFITLEQQAKSLSDYGTGLTNPNFAEFAEACGGLGLRVEEPESIRPSLEKAIASNRPAILDIVVDPDQLIMPPKIEVRHAVNFGLAKIREAFSNQ
jgi:pyruvate oxidase